MAANRTVYHVGPNATRDRWIVSREGDETFREEFRTKEDAVSAAKARARREEPAQVKVHDSRGNMDYERTYGADPRRTPG